MSRLCARGQGALAVDLHRAVRDDASFRRASPFRPNVAGMRYEADRNGDPALVGRAIGFGGRQGAKRRAKAERESASRVVSAANARCRLPFKGSAERSTAVFGPVSIGAKERHIAMSTARQRRKAHKAANRIRKFIATRTAQVQP